jgi:serine protease Do
MSAPIRFILRRSSLPIVASIVAIIGSVYFIDRASSKTDEAPTTSPISASAAQTASKKTASTTLDSKQNPPPDAARPGEPPLDPARLGAPLPRNLWVELSKLINPTVVSITTSTAARQRPARYRDPLQDFLEEFWGGRGPNFGPPPSRRQPLTALGTGFVIREDGLIITNNHVVEQAEVIKVQLDANSDKLFDAEIIGRDARTDIALIKIDAKRPLPVARLGNSKDVQVGEWVAAFGNPYGHAHTMTTGIVSAIGREIAEINRFPFIQTDASINPGNSGGPLVNSLGFVIGVNTAIDARAQGIGFAIPIDDVKRIVAQLEKEGRVRRGFIGVGIASVSDQVAQMLGLDEPKGVLITQILRDGPADKAGIRPYDLVIEFGGKKTDDPSELQNAVGDTAIGDAAKAKIWRFDDNGKRKELLVSVTVTENPDEPRRSPRTETKQYFGQKAPFDLGFKFADLSPQLAREFGITADMPQGPVITEVDRGSAAASSGLQPGDVVLDVNRTSVAKATDIAKLLKKGRNFLRVARGNTVLVLPLGN